MDDKPNITVNKRGFVVVDGVKVAKCVVNAQGERVVQFLDKNKFRAAQRGTRQVVCSVSALQEAIDKTD